MNFLITRSLWRKLQVAQFSTTLIHTDFKLDADIFELRQLKKLIKSWYQHFKHSASLWKTIALKQNDQFPQILLLVKFILSMEWTSSTVEIGFSTVNRMLPNVRLSLSKVRLNNLLMLWINVPKLTALDPEYESKLIDKGAARYLSTNRYNSRKPTTQVKQHQYGSSSGNLFLPTIRWQTTTSNLLNNENYLEISED